MQRFLLTLGFLLWFASSALALPSYCTLTGTVLSPDGTACAGCKITITTAGTQEVGGATFPGGKARSWTTESDGDLPAGVEAARTLIVKIQIDKGATVTVQIPDTSTADISTLLLEPIDVPSSTNINSLSGTLSVVKGGTGAAPDGDDQVLVSTGTTAADWETIGDCDGVTKALNYDVTTNAFSCNSTVSATDLVCTGCVADTDLASDSVTEAKLAVTGGPTDEYCLTYEGTGPTMEWQVCGGSSGYATVQDEGIALTQRTTIDFAGAGVTCADSGGTKTLCTISGGGSSAFTDITSGTNTTAAMVVDTGASLATSGSGTIAATSATALAANPSDCGANTYATTIAASGNLTCSAVDFGQLASGTNTAASMVVSTGSSLTTAGSGTISATTANNATSLASNPTDCASDTYATTIAASGNLTCSTVTNAGLAGSIAMSKTLLTADAGLLLTTNSLATASSETGFITGSTSLPGTCGEGAVYQDTDSGGTETYTCTAANTWTKYIASTDNVATATALAANPADCAADTYATTIAASGALTCATVTNAGLAGSIAVSKTLATGGAGIDINTNDFVTDSTETSFLANSGTLPGTCGEGAVYQDTDSGGTETYVCTAANTWTKTVAATDNVATATALAADPSDCAANRYATTIAASGNLTCAQVDLASGVTGTLPDGNVSDTITASNYLPLTGGTLSGPLLVNSSITGSTGSNADAIDFSNTFTMTGAAQVVNGFDFSPTATLSAAGEFLRGLNIGGSWAVSSTTPLIDGIYFAPTVDYSNTTDPFPVYRVSAGTCATAFTSSTANGPLYQDCWTDLTSITYSGASDLTDTSTATGNPWAPIGFLQQSTAKTSGTGDLTINHYDGLRQEMTYDAGNAASALIINNQDVAEGRTPGCVADNCGPGTVNVAAYSLVKGEFSTALDTGLTITNAYGMKLESFDKATNNYSLYSDTATTLHNGGVGDFGDNIADLTTNTVSVVDVTPTVDMTGNGTIQGFVFAPTMTNSSASAGSETGLRLTPTISSNAIDTFSGVQMDGTITQSALAFGLAGGSYILDHSTTYTSSVAATHPRQAIYTLRDHPTISSTASSGTATMPDFFSVLHAPTVSRTGAGTFTLTNDIGLYMSGTYTESAGTLAVTNRIGVKYNDVTNTTSATAITNNIGVDIAALSTATTNIGIRNADTTVYTPAGAQSISATSSTLTPSATALQVTATGAIGTLVSNPQISDGVDGQIIHIIYSQAANSFTFADGLGLQLAGTMLMDQGNTLTLMYNSALGDWVEIARALN